MRFVLLWLLVCCLLPPASRADASPRVAIAIWNVENLFDAEDDAGSDDNWLKHWTDAHYRRKLANLAAAIGGMNGGRGPDVLCLVEVENRRVLEDLRQLLPDPTSYGIVHHDGDAGRGIEVALLTRFPVLSSRSHWVWHGIRDLLQADLDVHGTRLTVLVTHWKSRYGGEFDTAERRTLCAARTYQIYREIVRDRPDAEVLLAGDFNDYPTSLSLTGVLQAHGNADLVWSQSFPTRLYNPTCAIDRQGQGTYFYEGQWGFLDQIIVSAGLLDEQGLALVPGSLQVYDHGGSLRHGEGVHDFDPAKGRWDGCSDHLPLVAELAVREPRPPLLQVARERDLQALLWVQTAGEYRALCYQAFAHGLAQLDTALASRPADALPPAIIVDLDETILDNSAYQVQSARDGFVYPEQWSAWTALAAAPAVPGAQEFLAAVAARQVDIFYVTNRKESERAATLINLRLLGLPCTDDAHLLPRQNTSGKEARRQSVAARHQVLLLVGDNLSDFAADFDQRSRAERNLLVDQRRADFGTRFLLLPNPIYGDWDAALFGHRHELSPAAQDWLRLAQLRGFTVSRSAAAVAVAPPARLDPNTATAEQLTALNGIGPELARRIVEHRQTVGTFREVADLLLVKGIGPATLAAIQPHLALVAE